MEEKDRYTVTKSIIGINYYIVKNLCEDDMKYEMHESQIEIIDNVINRLGEYENLNLSPQEVEDLKKENAELKLQSTTKNNTLSFAQSSYDLLKEENKNLKSRLKLLDKEYQKINQILETDNIKTRLTCQKLTTENEKLNLNWNALCNFLGNEIVNDKDCENSCCSEFLEKVNEIKRYDVDLEAERTKLAVEKLEEIKNHIDNEFNAFYTPDDNYNREFVNNYIDEMLAELKGGQND
jgi:hypothetical protein